MTHTPHENAADLAREEELSEAAEAFFEDQLALRSTMERTIISTGRDKDAWIPAFAEAMQSRDAVAEGDTLRLADGTSVNLPALYELVEAHAIVRSAPTLAEIERVFGEPILNTEGGDWHLIDSKDKADLAGNLSRTAISHYWEGLRPRVEQHEGGESHDWLVLTNWMGRGVVAMAALREGTQTAYENALSDCHVTGTNNAPAWEAYEEDIRAIAAHRGLQVYPNHMGMPMIDLKDYQDDLPSP